MNSSKISMKTKILFSCAVVIQLCVMFFLIFYSIGITKSAEKSGRIAVYNCTAYDPFHPFKGRYLDLTVTTKNTVVGDRLSYYIQENLADNYNKLSNRQIESLKPQIEVYVDSKGRYVQKALTVEIIDGQNQKVRIPIEEYLKK